MKLKTIVVPLDGSVVAEAALSPAIDLARDAGARLVLLRAAEAHARPMADPVEAQVSVMREAQEYLSAAKDRAVTAGVPHDRSAGRSSVVLRRIRRSDRGEPFVCRLSSCSVPVR